MLNLQHRDRETILDDLARASFDDAASIRRLSDELADLENTIAAAMDEVMLQQWFADYVHGVYC